MEQGIQQLEKGHKDNLDELIDIYPYGDEGAKKGVYANMDKAIKKATTVISKHSMVHKVKGEKGKREVSNWIDDSYFVIGKSHFFKDELSSAHEIFDFIRVNYDYLPIRYDAAIWDIKVLLAKNEIADAYSIMDQLDNDDQFPEKKLGEYSAVKAHYFIQTEEFNQAIIELTKTITLTKKKSSKIRYTYLLAQLYDQQGNTNEAGRYFDAVVKMNPPYEYAFKAKINMALAFSGNDATEIKKVLTKMIKDEKNKEYLDQIYYSLADISLKEGEKETGIDYLLKSSFASMGNQKQKGKTYLRLADLYFVEPAYEPAHAYYDSACAVLPENFPNLKKIVEKKNSLTLLVSYLNKIAEQDSLQRIARMSELDRNDFIDKLIDVIVLEEERLKEAKEADDLFDLNNNGQTDANLAAGGWYFNNPAAIGNGRSEFMKRYGTRKLEDNWRRSNKQSSNSFGSPEVAGGDEGDETDKGLSPNKTREFYLKSLPLTDSAMTASNDILVEAYYNLGMTYHQNLYDPVAAAKTYETLLEKINPNKYQLQVYYILYRLYKQEGNTSKSDYYKGLLMSKYPDSEYAQIIKNPNLKKEQERALREATDRYKELYTWYSNREYDRVVKEGELVYTKYKETDIAPDVMLLLAMANGFSTDRETFKKELQEVRMSYPKHRVAEDAQSIIDRINGMNKTENMQLVKEKEKSGPFKFSMLDPHYACFMVDSKKNEISELKTKLSDFNKEFFSLHSLKVKSIIWDGDDHMLIVMGLPTGEKAVQYYKALRTEEFMKPLTNEGAVIFISSQANYNTFSKDKNLAEYIEFFVLSYDIKEEKKG